MNKLVIAIPSYCRPNNYFYKNIISKHNEIINNCLYFVREEQYEDYVKAMPLLNKNQIIAIPKGKVDGVGSTRQFILDWMSIQPIDWFVISDDDITDIAYVTYTEEHKANYHPRNYAQVINIIENTCEKLPKNCAIGTLQPRAFSKDFDVEVKIMTTRSPSQFVIYRNSICKNIPFNLKLFNKHGDDIGYACQIVSHGYDYFQIPCLVYSCWDSTFSGVLRTKENYKELFDKDYENAKKFLPEECLGRSRNDYHFTFIKPKEVLEWRKHHNENNN